MFVDVFAHTIAELRLPSSTLHRRSWIAENGGFTHPSLHLETRGARGRGLVALEPLEPREPLSEPLCRLPWRLLISEELAEKSLSFGRELRVSAEVQVMVMVVGLVLLLLLLRLLLLDETINLI